MKPSYILVLLSFLAPALQASSEKTSLSDQIKATAPQRMVTRKKQKDKLAKYGKVPPTRPITFDTFEEKIKKDYQELNRKLDRMLEKNSAPDPKKNEEKEKSSKTIIEEPTTSEKNINESGYSSKEEEAAAISSFRYRILVLDFAAFATLLGVAMGSYAFYKIISKRCSSGAKIPKM